MIENNNLGAPLIHSLLGQDCHIVLNKALVKELGLVNAMLLSCFLDKVKIRGADNIVYLLAEMAEDCACTTRTIQNHLEELIEKGLISRRLSSQAGRNYLYAINYQAIANLIQNSKFFNAQKITNTQQNQNTPINEQKQAIKPQTINRAGIDKANEIQRDFEALWKLYPKKVSKQQAFKAYIKARTGYRSTIGKYDAVSGEEIVAGLRAFIESSKEKNTEMKYIPHLATWLNNRRWEDGEDKNVRVTASVIEPEEQNIAFDDLSQMVKEMASKSRLIMLSIEFLLKNKNVYKPKDYDLFIPMSFRAINTSLQKGREVDIYIVVGRKSGQEFDKFLAEKNIFKDDLRSNPL